MAGRSGKKKEPWHRRYGREIKRIIGQLQPSFYFFNAELENINSFLMVKACHLKICREMLDCPKSLVDKPKLFGVVFQSPSNIFKHFIH